ncbi:hypothetical protein AYO22_03328 [Fonsecaea multimorphosa]|nr:hypothetical protein AYO22_03328 [Fonsecaea multimorphosa]
MPAILCVAAKHLTTLCPQHGTKYAHEWARLMARTVRLFAPEPLTAAEKGELRGSDGHCASPSTTSLPEILQVWFQAIPVFIDHGSVFTSVVHQNPRLCIEQALAQEGEDPARFVKPLMSMWDDPRYQTGAYAATTTATYTELTTTRGPTSYAWRLLRGLDTELSRCHSLPPAAEAASTSEGAREEKQNLERFRDAVTRITTGCTSSYSSADHHPDTPTPAALPSSSSSSQLARSSVETIARRISPPLS